jgi:mono/diheme cytochrome c family protein
MAGHRSDIPHYQSGQGGAVVSARFMAAASIGFAALGFALIGIPAVATAQDKPAAAPAAGGNEALRAKGRELFSNWGCNACHTFADAGAHGDVGPQLDGEHDKAVIVSRVTNGQGAMPAFGGQMTEEEIADLAAYLTAFAKK